MPDMSTKTLSVQEVQNIEEFLKLNKDLVGLFKQKQQFEMALAENKSLMEKIKNKAVTKILMPSIGGLYAQVNCGDEVLNNRLKELEKQFEISIKGIEGQIVHKQQFLTEDIMRTLKSFYGYCVESGFEPPKKEDFIKPVVETK